MIASAPEAADRAATHTRHDRRVPERLSCRDVRHVYLDHGQVARLDRVAERVGVVGKRAGVEHDRLDPVGARREQPVHQLALMVRLPPRHGVAGLAARALLDRAHDLGKRLRSVRLRVAGTERPEVGSEQVQHVHVGAPISSSTARSSSSVTPSTIVGSPTARNSTKRTPPWNFLSIRTAVRMSCAGGSGPAVSSPSELSTPTLPRVRASAPTPPSTTSRAAKTLPDATPPPRER